MTLRKVLRLLFLTGSTACVALAFAAAGLWVGTGLAILTGLVFLIFSGSAARWMPTVFLSGMVCIAAAGLLAGSPAFLMILGAGLALVAWDLMSFDGSLERGGPARASAPVDKRHVLSLAAALGLGLALAALGLTLSFRIPFPVLLLIVVLCLFSLDRVFRRIS